MGVKSRLKVGIFFNARVEQGGLYQYALTLVHCLYRYVPEFDYSLYLATLEAFPIEIKANHWKVIRFSKLEILWRMSLEIALNFLARKGIEIPFKIIPCYRQVSDDNPDVMLYVKPTPHVFQWNYQAIFPIHDLQHRLQPNFPEVSDKGEYKRRENLYKHSTSKAVAILTDSQTGKEDVSHLYSVDESKIYPLPYIAPTFRDGKAVKISYEEINRKYSLPENYLFYPATFWAHKNHARLIQAIRMIADEKGVLIPLVLTGSQWHEYPVLIKLVGDLHLQDTIYFIGYVPDEELTQLYSHALALVMPTFFGPTNIPVLEAWEARCPVITSDIRGIREQVGNAGLLVDPKNVSAIAGAIWKIYTDSDTKERIIHQGLLRVNEWTPEKFSKTLSDVIKISAS